LDQDPDWVEEVEEIVCAVETQQLDELPVTDKDISTAQDPVLPQVFNYTLHGWPVYSSAVDSKVRPYFKTQLTIHNGCLLWGLRVVIPERHSHKVMKLLHSGHPGMTRMKSLATLHIWWPDIDSAIEVHTMDVPQLGEILLVFLYISGNRHYVLGKEYKLTMPDHSNVVTSD